MTLYLTTEDLLHAARVVMGEGLAVRDIGLLESAAARPRTTVAGEDAYPGVLHKAAALLHSVVRNHALVDGDKRLGFVAVAAFAELNGYVTDPADEDSWFELIMAVAGGELADVSEIAERLTTLVQ